MVSLVLLATIFFNFIRSTTGRRRGFSRAIDKAAPLRRSPPAPAHAAAPFHVPRRSLAAVPAAACDVSCITVYSTSTNQVRYKNAIQRTYTTDRR